MFSEFDARCLAPGSRPISHRVVRDCRPTRAREALAAKNSLTAADAKLVEDAFEIRLSKRHDRLSPALRHAGAVRQKLRHDTPRCIDAGVREGDRIRLGSPFRHCARHQFPVSLGEIAVAPLP